jgi:hypothetical protein
LITGTFLDEITHDIPSQNWSPDDWGRDFDSMAADGLDTVVLIRAGYRQRATFDSRTLQRMVPGMLPAYTDLVDVFLHHAERCGLTLFFGTYDAGALWDGGNYSVEAEINKPFCAEVVERYGHRRAFGGWYISHEIATHNAPMLEVYRDLSAHLRRLKDLPILMSPYIHGVKQFGADALTLDQHADAWRQTFAELEGYVDIAAFQDGNVPLAELPDYLRVNRELASLHGIRSWSNCESFGRDTPIKFPPADWNVLRYKIEQAQAAGMEKTITFEYSHFMSPNATLWPSARALNTRYAEWRRSGLADLSAR